jgi:hypothetical protein
MDAQDKEALQTLMRSGVAKAIMDQAPYIILYQDSGKYAACLCKVSDIKEVLSYNPDTEFAILCTIKADGEIEVASGNDRIKHIK